MSGTVSPERRDDALEPVRLPLGPRNAPVGPDVATELGMRVLSVVGARPNFMKLAPVERALRRRSNVDQLVVHTGQHYDHTMSGRFFEELEIPAPDRHLEVGSGSHAQQTAAIMQRLEPVYLDWQPDLILTYGDVNSTLAAALVAAKLGIRVGHVEAGLRSGDWSMPEEINRVVTDRLSDLLFTPSRDANENLAREGIPPDRVHLVGNVMIDSLVIALPRAKEVRTACTHGVENEPYVVVTLHRPSNVDDRDTLAELLGSLAKLGQYQPVLFPVHPRTRARMESYGLLSVHGSDLRLLEPLSYIEMLSLVLTASLVITDSGGLQEETTYLGVPCLTVRPSTERPITVTHGTNQLVSSRGPALILAAEKAIANGRGHAAAIELWDGAAAERIAACILKSERDRSDEL